MRMSRPRFLAALMAAAVPVLALAGNVQPDLDTPTQDQLALLAGQLGQAPVPPGIVPMWDAARPDVTEILRFMSCYHGLEPWRGLNQLILAPGVTPIGLPMLNMSKHDDGACLSVSKIDGFSRLDDNAFIFHVTFAADDSRETTSFRYVMARVRGTDWRMQYGTWSSPAMP